MAGIGLAMTRERPVARLFLYGTLLDRGTLSARAGDPRLAARSTPATLTGWRRVALRGGRYPTLRRSRLASVSGAIVTVPARALARLATYEGDAYRLTRVVVQAANGKTAAHTWIAPGGTCRPWRE